MAEIVDLRPHQNPRPHQDPERIAHDLYLKLRPNYPDAPQTVQALATLLTKHRDRVPADAPPGDQEMLLGWSVANGWERGFERSCQLQALDGDTLRATQRVTQYRTFLDAAIDALEYHLKTASEDRGEAWTKIFSTLTAQTAHWDKAVREAEDTLRQMALERQTEDARQKGEEVYAHLLSQYDGLGPHYQVLCRRLAETVVRMEQANASGRIVTADEHARMTDQYVRLIGQLQKYTETTKSEAVSKEAQSYVRAAVKVLEEVVAPVQPQLWARALRTLERKIGAKQRDEGVA